MQLKAIIETERPVLELNKVYTMRVELQREATKICGHKMSLNFVAMNAEGIPFQPQSCFNAISCDDQFHALGFAMVNFSIDGLDDGEKIIIQIFSGDRVVAAAFTTECYTIQKTMRLFPKSAIQYICDWSEDILQSNSSNMKNQLQEM